MDEKTNLCVSNAYLHKYYLGSSFAKLPTAIKEELQVACVLFTEKAGGILTLSLMMIRTSTFTLQAMMMTILMMRFTAVCFLADSKGKKRSCLQGLKGTIMRLLKERYERL